jgi:hypothetical protein
MAVARIIDQSLRPSLFQQPRLALSTMSTAPRKIFRGFSAADAAELIRLKILLNRAISVTTLEGTSLDSKQIRKQAQI